MGRDFLIEKTEATGALALALSVAARRVCRLISVTVAFDTAPSTSENLTVTVNANAGAAYDVTLYSTDPAATSATSIVYQPDQPLWLDVGDSIDVAFANTDTNTYGVQVTLQEML